MTAIFDGNKFEGPFPITGEDFPSSPGVYLICTGSAGGDKIIALYGATDMKKDIASNPFKGDWMKAKDDGNNSFSDDALRAYYIVVDRESDRDRMITGLVERRPYKIPCYRPPMDDF